MLLFCRDVPQPGPSGIKRKKSSIKTEVPITASVSQLNGDSDYDSDDTFISKSHHNPIQTFSPTNNRYSNVVEQPSLPQSSRSEVLTAPDLQLDWASDSSINDSDQDDEVVYVPTCARVNYYFFHYL